MLPTSSPRGAIAASSRSIQHTPVAVLTSCFGWQSRCALTRGSRARWATRATARSTHLWVVAVALLTRSRSSLSTVHVRSSTAPLSCKCRRATPARSAVATKRSSSRQSKTSPATNATSETCPASSTPHGSGTRWPALEQRSDPTRRWLPRALGLANTLSTPLPRVVSTRDATRRPGR